MTILSNYSVPLYTQRWYVDGTVQCFTEGHAPLAVFAILVLAVCVIVIVMVAVIAVGRLRVSIACSHVATQ